MIFVSNHRRNWICNLVANYFIIAHASGILNGIHADANPNQVDLSNPMLEISKTIEAQQPHSHETIVSQEPSIVLTPLVPNRDKKRNYASMECAKVVETNPEAKKASHIINEMIDEYMLNPCKTKIWFVIELCETIQATRIEIANYELFSSTPKDFSVYFSDTYPAPDWKLVGQFTATDSRTSQVFDLNQVGFGKYIRVELHSHYGNEHYCPISEVKVFGASMVEEYEHSEKSVDQNKSDLPAPIKPVQGKVRRKTSAFRVYKSMMTAQTHACGISQTSDKNSFEIRTLQNKKTDQVPSHLHQTIVQPTMQPVAPNRTTPLKPSIFVELSNKVKALETSLKGKIDDIERRLSDNELRCEKFLEESKANNSNINRLTLIVIAYLVYKLMLDLM